ncbi:MAG: VOC family protein [Micrococcaceae bacterium]
MKLRWYSIVIDCHDVSAQARWWAQALDWQVVYDSPDEAVIIPQEAPPGLDMSEPVPAHRWHHVPPGLVFVTVPDDKTVKNRLHIDLAPHLEDDREAQIQRLIDAGARRVDVGQDETEVTWTVLADPEGNEFCVLSSRDE